MDPSNTPNDSGQGRREKSKVWRRGDAVFQSSARPSLSPVKRKMPREALNTDAPPPAKPERPQQAPEAAAPAPPQEDRLSSAMAAVAAAAQRGWDEPEETPTEPLTEPLGELDELSDEPLFNKEEPFPGEPFDELDDGEDFDPDEFLPPEEPLADEADLKTARKKKRVRIIISVLIPVFAIVLVVSLWQIFSIQTEYKDAVDEYDQLRQQVFPTRTATGASAVVPEEAEEEIVFDFETVRALNPDCVGWIEIPGTALSYPLVRANDNDKYLNHTFLGAQNAAGTIFMDYRNSPDLQGQHLILYGHNMKNGSMFGLLPKYLDSSYLQSHPTLVLRNGSQTFTYQILSARVTDAYDPAYQPNFDSAEAFSTFAESYGAPAGTSQMLTMSTCTNVNDDERILVHAALVSVGSA